MQKKVLILLFVMLVLGGMVTMSCNNNAEKEPLRIIRAADIKEFFLENREHFEAVVEQIMLFETELTEFYLTNIYSENFRGDRMTIDTARFGTVALEEGPLYDALLAFAHITRDIRFSIGIEVREGNYQILFGRITNEIYSGGEFSATVYIGYTKDLDRARWIHKDSEKLAENWYLEVFGNV